MKKALTQILLISIFVILALVLLPQDARALSITEGELTGDQVSMRDEPSKKGDIITKLPKGAVVKIKKTNVNAEWHQVVYGGRTGYVNRMYINWDRCLTDLDYVGTVVNVKEFVNVRKDASAASRKLGTAAKGETYPILEANLSSGWHKIKYKNQVAYVSAKYIDLQAKVSNKQLSDLSVKGGTMAPRFSPEDYGYMVTTRNSSVTINVKANKGVKVTMNNQNTKSLKVDVPDGSMKTVRIKLNGVTSYTVYIMRNVITVGTWNIKRGNGHLLEQGRLVRDELPDIMGFQEVFKKDSSGNIVDNLASLKTKHMTNTRFCKAINTGGGEFGHGMVTCYKVLDHDTWKLSSPGVEQRCLSRTVLNINGQRVSFYNTHLSYNSKSLRKTQFEEIAAIMKKDSNKYKILTGDFNAAYSEFSALGSNYKVINTPSTKYYDYYGKEIKLNEIDNIIVSKNIKVVNSRIVRTKFSDHCPVFAYLRLT